MSCRYQNTAHMAFKHHDLIQMIKLQTVGCKTICITGELYGLVRLNTFGIGQNIQKFTAKTQCRLSLTPFINSCSAQHPGLAYQLNFRGVAVGDGMACCGRAQTTVLIERANLHLINFKRVCVWVMTCLTPMTSLCRRPWAA